MKAAAQALDLVRDGSAIGLGSGRAARAFVTALAQRVQAGLRVRAVPTSQPTATLAAELHIPLVGLDDVPFLDLTVDGADEVDPRLDLIKGYGGALVREKIVAAASQQLIILVTPEKLVPVLGARGVVPVEVVPFALPLCRERLRALGYQPRLRLAAGAPFTTDNGNCIIDCGVSALSDPPAADAAIHAIPGVVGTGLFLGMASTVLVEGEGDAPVRTLRRGP